MKAILYKDVTNLGREGDIVRVTPGFFRNYLQPKKLAILASDSNLKELEFKKKRIEAIRAEKTSEAQALAAQLNEVELVIRHRCGEKGQLFGAITNADIAKALLDKKFDVDRRKIVIHEPIKHIGEVEVDIRVYPEVTAQIKVIAKPEEDQEAEIMAALKRAEEEAKAQAEAAAKARAEKAAAEAAEAAEADGEAGEGDAPAEEAKADDASAETEEKSE